MDEELDIVELENDDGGTLQLRVDRYFFFNGEEYVILSEDLTGNQPDAPHYIMRVEPDDDDPDMENFIPIEDEKLEEKLEKAIRSVEDDEEE